MENLEGEIWRDIEDSLHYAVSNKGRIKRSSHKKLHNINRIYYITKDKIKQPSNNNTKKYWRIQIKYKDGKSKTLAVHRLVAQAFIPNPENMPQVNHIDGNKNNNYVENLEWCTNEYNMNHSWGIGLRDSMYEKLSGEKSIFNKYSEDTIRKIPILLMQGLTYKQTAAVLKIPYTLITEIKSGRAWKRLNLEIPETRGNKITVYQYDLDRNLIKEWSSIIDAASFYHIKPATLSWICKKSLTKIKAGFIWSHELF